MKSRSVEERFWAKVTKTESCWLWTAAKRDGYGFFNDIWLEEKGHFRTVMAHRWSYEHHVGPIPKGMVIDHLCRVRNCVNPAHMEVVTPWENVRRGESPNARALRTNHCGRGHEYVEGSYWLHGTRRACKECYNINRRRRRASEVR